MAVGLGVKYLDGLLEGIGFDRGNLPVLREEFGKRRGVGHKGV
jgi:hypothetical protein